MNYYNYFTEIEEHFVRRRGKHMFVSPMDWSLIATWRDSGVPLHVALRGIDRAMDGFLAKQPRSESRISSLFYCHASVMEEHAQHLESHLGAAPAEGTGEAASGPGKCEILEFLNVRIEEIKSLPAKHKGLEESTAGIARIVQRLEEICRSLETDRQLDYEALDRDLSILDEDLVEDLRTATADERMDAWEQEARKELKIYRKKLPKETYAKILDNFLRTRIHRHYGVGELSLFHM
jgi:hypothetical protein